MTDKLDCYLSPSKPGLDPVCLCCGDPPVPATDGGWRRCHCGMGLWVERKDEVKDRSKKGTGP